MRARTSVTSTGVPNTVVVLKNDNRPAGITILNGTAKACSSTAVCGGALPAGTGYAVTSRRSSASTWSPVISMRRRVTARRCARHSRKLAMRGAAPCGCRLSRSAFIGGCQQLRRHAGEEFRQRTVRSDDVPVPVDRERRIGPLRLQHQIDGAARRRQRRIIKRALRKDRRIAGGDQQHVALAHRNIELLGEMQHHLAARLRAPGLDEAQVPRRNLGLARQAGAGSGAGAGAIGAAGRRRKDAVGPCRKAYPAAPAFPLPRQVMSIEIHNALP